MQRMSEHSISCCNSGSECWNQTRREELHFRADGLTRKADHDTVTVETRAMQTDTVRNQIVHCQHSKNISTDSVSFTLHHRRCLDEHYGGLVENGNVQKGPACDRSPCAANDMKDSCCVQQSLKKCKDLQGKLVREECRQGLLFQGRLKPRAQPNTEQPSKTESCDQKESTYHGHLHSHISHGLSEYQTAVNQTSSCSWKKKNLDLGAEDQVLEEEVRSLHQNSFKTAREQYIADSGKSYGQDQNTLVASYRQGKKSLGTRRGPNNRFVPPVLGKAVDSTGGIVQREDHSPPVDLGMDERLKSVDPKIIELIKNEIMEHKPHMSWDDIAGLSYAKKIIQEIVVWPLLRPDIFTGLRGPPKGLLLFGPPGTGKTLIGKCIASQSKSTFFCISASSLTSKWVGEGEKMVRGLFQVARCHQPAVIFIDEVDSLLSQRCDGEHEASRRIKTEFLVQLDGAATEAEDRLLVIGATNRPQEIDEAARRRFVKRLYIPLPDHEARQHLVRRLLVQQNCHLTDSDITYISQQAEGFSGADVTSLCREAAMGPVRSIPVEEMETICTSQVRPITMSDFTSALLQVRPSVSSNDLDVYIHWNNTFGSAI